MDIDGWRRADKRADEIIENFSRWHELTDSERRMVLLAVRQGLMELSNFLNALPPSSREEFRTEINGVPMSVEEILEQYSQNIFEINEALGLNQPSC